MMTHFGQNYDDMGADSIDFVKALKDCGLVFDIKGDYANALEKYKKCLEI